MWLRNSRWFLVFVTSFLHVLASNGFHGSSTTQNASRYLFSKEKGNWYEGRDYCQQRGYHLVEIDSPEEQGFLNYLSPYAEYYARWIGMVDANMTGLYMWDQSGTAVSYTHWIDDIQPMVCASGPPCCGYLEPDNGIWFSAPCEHPQFLYICEK